jgi:hypothetical protein
MKAVKVGWTCRLVGEMRNTYRIFVEEAHRKLPREYQVGDGRTIFRLILWR